MTKTADLPTSLDEPAQSSTRPAGPGLVLVLKAGEPTCVFARFQNSALVLGRGEDVGLLVADLAVSRHHTRVTVEGDRLRVMDLRSRNGTSVDGQRITDMAYSPWPHVIRLGSSLVVPVHDLGPFLKGDFTATSDRVVGPLLSLAHLRIEHAARHGDSVLITGESGTGKELAARRYHVASGRKGPFLAVNCATIPSGLAERLLFGTRRGAYSGAAENAPGYVQEADGGTLFLDEIADLEPLVQPKLLRLLEEREVMELGGTKPRKVDLQVCAATHKSLRAEVERGRFREDLYYRIGKPEIRLPSLAQRPEEVPSLVSMQIRHISKHLRPTAGLVEACLLRRWRGNVRELLLDSRQAAHTALAAGRAAVEAGDLPPTTEEDIETPQPRQDRPDHEVLEILREEGGNVSGAARKLGWHRTQLRRWLHRRNLRAADVLASSA